MDEEEIEIDMERCVRAYRNIRDVRKAKAKEFKKADAELKAKLELIAANILEFFIKTKQENTKTSVGTAYKKLKTQASCSDWLTFYAWVAKHNAFHFLHKRITEKEVAKYQATHNKELPPGVRVNQQWVIGVLGLDGKDEDGDDD